LEGKIKLMFPITRVRIRWIGRNPVEIPADRGMQRASAMAAVARSNEARVLTTLDLPNARLRVRWLGLGALKRPFALAVAMLILLIAYSAWTSPNDANTLDETFNPEQGLLADLIGDDINLGDQTIRLIHSPLDIGQAKDAFDHNLDTLMRGRDANPFIMEFDFPQPQEIKGFVMDMGRMDFYLRVKVYAPGSTEFVLYEGEYRQQPPIPHVDMDFDRGPGQVKRIQIEIEQIDPPEEVHVHVREVVFKK
jgi:hypothetical protein